MEETLTEEQKAKAEKVYKSFSKKKYSREDEQDVLNKESDIMEKMKSSNLSQYIDDVRIFFCMLKDSLSGVYKLPVTSIAAIVGTLLYVFSPIDIVPDFIPVLGLLDDAAVLAACVRAFKYDIEKYKDK